MFVYLPRISSGLPIPQQSITKSVLWTGVAIYRAGPARPCGRHLLLCRKVVISERSSAFLVTTDSLISNLRATLNLVAKGFTSAEAAVFHLQNRSLRAAMVETTSLTL